MKHVSTAVDKDIDSITISIIKKKIHLRMDNDRLLSTPVPVQHRKCIHNLFEHLFAARCKWIVNLLHARAICWFTRIQLAVDRWISTVLIYFRRSTAFFPLFVFNYQVRLELAPHYVEVAPGNNKHLFLRGIYNIENSWGAKQTLRPRGACCSLICYSR